MVIFFIAIKRSVKVPLQFTRRLSLGIGLLASLAGIQSFVGIMWGRTVSISVSTALFWPKVPSGFDFKSNATAKYVSGGFQSAEVEVLGISFWSRLMLAGSAILMAVVVVSIALFVARIAKAIQEGGTLTQALALNAATTGWIVLVAGLVSSVLDRVGNNIAQMQLFGSQRSYGWDLSSTFKNPWLLDGNISSDRVFGILMPSNQFMVELWPVAIALVLLLVSKVLNRANKLEQEVEGLV